MTARNEILLINKYNPTLMIIEIDLRLYINSQYTQNENFAIVERPVRCALFGG